MTHLIYLITNLTNNKKYIGQTIHGQLERRWHEHIYTCTKYNRLLSNAISKYLKILEAEGKSKDDLAEYFNIKIIEDNIPEEIIDDKEIYYIKLFNTFYLNKQGYNMTQGGQGLHGYKHTKSTRLKIKNSNLNTWKTMKMNDPDKYQHICEKRSLGLKGKPKSEEHRKKLSIIASARVGEKNPFYGKHFSKESIEKLRESHAKNLEPINAFELESGKLWKTFRSAMEAVRELHLQESANSRILLVCKEAKGHAYNYIWRYKKDYNVDQLDAETLKSEHTVPQARPVLQFDLENNLIAEFSSAAEASRALQPNISKQRALAKIISTTCSGKQKTGYKFIWRYKISE